MGHDSHRHAMRGRRRVKRAPVVTQTLIDPANTRKIISFRVVTATDVETSAKRSTTISKETPTHVKATATSTSFDKSKSTINKDLETKARTSSERPTHTRSTSKPSAKTDTEASETEESHQSSMQAKSTSIVLSTPPSSTSSPTSLEPSSATIAPVAQSSHTSAKSATLSTGATAGIAGIAVALVVVLAAVGIFFYRKNKSRGAYGKTEDEKSKNGSHEATQVEPQLSRSPSPVQTITSEKAPRVSLRPVTQFLPNLNVSTQPQQLQLATMDCGVTSIHNTSPAVGMSSTASLSNSESRKAPPPALILSAPVDETETRKTETPLVALSPTPSGFTEYSVSSVPETPVASVTTGSSSGSPVHRVQMDFAPSMGDELGLNAGQLVRILHEYDDGWALCVRLDRSQQGVCPRTCLSQRPVKPRPHGSPPGPAAYRRSGASGNNRPQSASAYQPQGRPDGHMRPQSPDVQHFPQPNGTGRGPTSPVPRSPGTGGYQKPQYVPASGRQSPQSPLTPRITISPSPPNSRPGSPSGQQLGTHSPSPTPRPAVAPIRPSPLSHETVAANETEVKKSNPPVFHAM